MTIAPSTQIAELLDLRMRVLHIIFHRQARRIVHTNIAAETPKNARDLEGQEFGIGAAERQNRFVIESKGQSTDRDLGAYRCLKLPYKTSTFSRDPVLMRSR